MTKVGPNLNLSLLSETSKFAISASRMIFSDHGCNHTGNA